MYFSEKETKDELKAVFYARSGNEPRYIGMPKSGQITYSENFYLATSLRDLMLDKNLYATGLPSYEGNFSGNTTRQITPEETFQNDLSERMHHAYEVEDCNTTEKTMWYAEQVKASALKTFNLHLQHNPSQGSQLRAHQSTLDEHAQKLGFADYTTFQKLMTTPGNEPSKLEYLKDCGQALFASERNVWKFNRRKHSVYNSTEFMENLQKTVKPLPNNHERPQQEKIYRNEPLNF